MEAITENQTKEIVLAILKDYEIDSKRFETKEVVSQLLRFDDTFGRCDFDFAKRVSYIQKNAKDLIWSRSLINMGMSFKEI